MATTKRSSLERRLETLQKKARELGQEAADVESRLRRFGLNEDILPWGLIKESELDMYLGGDLRGTRRLELYTFTEASRHCDDQNIYFQKEGAFEDVKGMEVLETLEEMVKGQLPRNFEVFDSKEAYFEKIGAIEEDATYRSVSRIHDLLKRSDVKDADFSLVSRERYGAGYMVKIRFVGNAEVEP